MEIDTRLLQAAEKYGTPLYVYDNDAIKATAQRVLKQFNNKISLFYAVKANPNPVLLSKMQSYIDGLDISSGGEFRLAEETSWDPEKFSFAGPGKTREELEYVIEHGCGSISVESMDDLQHIIEAGKTVKKVPKVSIRINPIELYGSFALKMGGKPTQFGIDEEDIDEVFSVLLSEVKAGNVEYLGVHIYAGTQCLEPDALIQNFRNSLRIVKEIDAKFSIKSKKINLGGGFGVPYYRGQQELDLSAVAGELNNELDDYLQYNKEAQFIIELGRYLVAPAGYYLTKVLAMKQSRGKTFAIVDGGMHHHLSASGNLGQTIRKNYNIRNLVHYTGEEKKIEIAGCLCTPIDLLGFNLNLPETRKGDILCFENSGAYGFSASPLFFLGHDTPRELVLEGNDVIVARDSISIKNL